ncbi:MAG: LysM peptidoglycan-binding domain-containing protein [Chloroflexi bacterium]|nr:MAG: LysM peptidoglycan-binding domain-containing protein [Chloroflexota bacterium]
MARRRRQRPIPWWVIGGGVMAAGLVLLLVVVAVLMLVVYPSSSGDQLPSGVVVAGVSIGGQSPEAAAQTLEESNLTGQPLLLVDGTRQWTTTLGNFGVRVDIPATIQVAEDAGSGADVTPWYTIDLNQTQTALVGLSEQINIDAVPGNPPQMGRVMEVPVMLNRLYQNLSGELADGVFELNMIDVAPPEPEETNTYTGQTTVHVVEQGQELALIARLYGVDMQDIVEMNELSDPDLLFVGQELTIPAGGMYEPPASQAPAPSTSVGKAIVVATDQQRVFAYENGQLVHSHLVSTGLPDTPTVLGDFKIYVKYTADDMSGPDYYLPSVPYTMYFHQGYGIHGTYWHNSFGRPMSHGCVNLPTPEAEWFFNWAEVGTPVRVV